MTTRSIPTKLALTEKTVEAICALPPGDRSRRYWDTKQAGFYLGFSKAGTASFCIRYTKVDGKDGDCALSLASKVTVEMARSAARDKLADIALNAVDPVEKRRQERQVAQRHADTQFGMALAAFIESEEKRRAGKPPLLQNYFLQRYVEPKFSKRRLDSISEQDVEDLLHEIRLEVAQRKWRKNAHGKNTANRCHTALRRFFRWAMRSRLAKANPAAFPVLNQIKTNKRHGRLNEQRFSLYWNEIEHRQNTAGGTSVSLAIMIYMVTLQRPIDVARAHRADFNLVERAWRIPGDRTKTEADYFIPLSDIALDLIKIAMSLTDSPFLFPMASDLKRHMAANLMSQHWGRVRYELLASGALDEADIELYDCRRFGRTQIRHKLGFDQEVAERVINHNVETDIGHLYDVHTYEDEIRAAQTAWGREVRNMTSRHVAVEH